MAPTEGDGPSAGAGIGADLVVGAAALCALFAIEAAWVMATAPLAFDTLLEQLRFVLYGTELALGAGVLLGGLLHGARAAARAVAGRLAGDPERWRAELYAALASPAILVGAAAAFQGRRAQLLPAHHVLAAGLGLAGIAAAWGAIRIALGMLRDAIGPARRIAGLGGWLRVAGLVAGAAGIYAVDATVLARLYLFFHLGLEAIAAALLVVAARLALLLVGRGRPPRLAPRRTAVLVVVGLGAVAWALLRLGRDTSLRAVAFEHTRVESRLVAAALELHLAKGEPTPPAARTGPPPTGASAPLPPGPRLPDADVFLITVDAMRADRLDPRTAPRLAAIADGGVRFDRAYAQVPHTSFSLATLLTGKYVYALAALGADTARHETLADIFKRERYKTAAFFPPSVFYIDHERFTEIERTAYHFEYVKYEYMPAPGRTDQVIRFLEGERPERVFLWVHYFDPHEPYEVHLDLPGAPTEHAPAVERYDGEVRFVDREVGRLVDYIRAHRPGAVIAFTADHGEEFGEHGGRYHGSTLYEEQVRVPLWIVGPGLPRRRVAGPVALVDLAPTLLALADIAPSARMRGQDLGPWLGPSPPPDARLDPVYAEIGAKKLLAVGDDRLICDLGRQFCELYDLAADPDERRNLGGRDPARVAGLRARLDGWLGAHSTFERSDDGGQAEAAREVLERGRLGDRQAAVPIAALLAAPDPGLRDEAARVLLGLPDDPATHPAIASARAAPGRAPGLLLDVLALRAGDRSLADALARRAAAPSVDGGPPDSTPDPPLDPPLDPRVRAEVALALAAQAHPAAVALAAAALDATDDEEVHKRLIAALGASRRREAVAPLVAHLAAVRTRVEVVRALGEIGDAACVPALSEAIGGEPYVPARAEMARVLGRLGDRQAVGTLTRLLSVETEEVVRAELRAALARLRSRR